MRFADQSRFYMFTFVGVPSPGAKSESRLEAAPTLKSYDNALPVYECHRRPDQILAQSKEVALPFIRKAI